jgi:hypothetical protein
MYKCLLLVCFIIGFGFIAKAQNPDTVAVKSKTDSLNRAKDSVTSKRYYPKITKEKTYHPDTLHDPHKAVMRSLMIPGWGQLYNHRWWKVPIIYVGMGLLVDGIIFNQNYYSSILTEAKLREKGITTGRNPDYNGISDSDIYSALDSYRRDRDLCILGLVGAWGIQMIDAYIDAKFIRSYTMDNNLSIKVSPSVMGQSLYAFSGAGSVIPAIKITFTLR